MNGKLLPVFFGWVDIFMRTEINQQHHHHSNGRRGTPEELEQGHLKTGAFCGMMLLYANKPDDLEKRKMLLGS